jgi:hypothetical protein
MVTAKLNIKLEKREETKDILAPATRTMNLSLKPEDWE